MYQMIFCHETLKIWLCTRTAGSFFYWPNVQTTFTDSFHFHAWIFFWYFFFQRTLQTSKQELFKLKIYFTANYQGGASICVNNAINRVLGINSKQSILRFLIIIMYLQYVSTKGKYLSWSLLMNDIDYSRVLWHYQVSY